MATGIFVEEREDDFLLGDWVVVSRLTLHGREEGFVRCGPPFFLLTSDPLHIMDSFHHKCSTGVNEYLN